MISDTIESNFCFVDKNRAVLILEGKDKLDFLQALTTNNIENIPKEDMIYTAILSPQGKYLFDFFVFSLSDNEIFIDIHKSRASAIKKFLEFYKLNSDVFISNIRCQILISSKKARAVPAKTIGELLCLKKEFIFSKLISPDELIRYFPFNVLNM